VVGSKAMLTINENIAEIQVFHDGMIHTLAISQLDGNAPVSRDCTCNVGNISFAQFFKI